jgi:hypothetical protein
MEERECVVAALPLPYRRFVIGPTLPNVRRVNSPQNKILRYSTARRSRNQNGARLWSKTQPQRVGIAAVLRLVLLQPRSEKSSRLATILRDADRLKICATPDTRRYPRDPRARRATVPQRICV